MRLKENKYSEIRDSMRPGDVIAFGGKALFSTVVKGVTDSKSVTHVGIIVQSTYEPLSTDEDQRKFINRIMESDKSPDGRVCITERLLSQRVQTYRGEMWWLRLREDIRKRINPHNFTQFVFLQQGKPYDLPQAIKAGIDFADESGLTLNQENFSKLFCSEFVAAALKKAGVLKKINASEVTPIELCQYQIYDPCYVIFNGEKKEIEDFNSCDKSLSESYKNIEVNKPKFAESTVRATAERSWVRKTPKKTIAKYNYLTEEEVDELRSTPEYRQYVENLMFERRSAEDFEKWVENYYRKHGNMYEEFGEHMGLNPAIVPGMVERVRQRHAGNS